MEELQGWRPRSRCALALRLGEEPLTLLEGGQGEDVRGQGKALVFDLPEVLLEQTLPLWIMLLMLPDLMVRSADLVASCCLDLRHEVAAALEGEGAPMFRRCHYGMTPVHPSMSTPQLSCFLRLYVGRHRPGAELLLEPIAWPEELQKPGQAGAESSGKQPRPRAELAERETQTEELQPRSAPRKVHAQPGPAVHAANEDFLPEIRLAAKEEPLELCLSEEDTEDLAAPPVPPQPLPPPVPHPPVEPALPMVSQLVGELMGSLPEKDAD